MATERRHFHRVPQALEVHYRLSGEFASSWHVATLINLSAGGLRLRTSEGFEALAQLELQLHLPGLREPLTLRGGVVWSNLQASGVVESGIEFMNVTPEQQLQIDEFVQFLRNSGPRTAPPS